MVDYNVVPILNRGAVLREIGNRKLLIIPEGYIELDDISWDILKKCDGMKKLSEILEELKNSYEGDPKAIEQDTVEFLIELKKEGLLSFIS